MLLLHDTLWWHHQNKLYRLTECQASTCRITFYKTKCTMHTILCFCYECWRQTDRQVDFLTVHQPSFSYRLMYSNRLVLSIMYAVTGQWHMHSEKCWLSKLFIFYTMGSLTHSYNVNTLHYHKYCVWKVMFIKISA